MSVLWSLTKKKRDNVRIDVATRYITGSSARNSRIIRVDIGIITS